MPSEITEILAALPPEARETACQDTAFENLLSSLGRRPVPQGRLPRLFAMGSMSARVMAAYVACRFRSLFLSPAEREAARAETHVRAAATLLAQMGYLRGAIMKVGQTLSTWPDLTPAPFGELLDRLHFEAPPMHYSLIREQIRRELGSTPEELFAEFEPEARAAASLGQVHQARLPSGIEVAVKVQYPGIGRTVRADLDNAIALLRPMRFLSEWENTMATLREIRRELVAETDYRQEAARAEQVRQALADLPDVVVPRIHPSFSTERVLTMDLVRGLHPPAFLEQNPSQEDRDRRGEQILRVCLRLHYSHRLLVGDPNPGNWFFLPDGRLGVVDFGCFQPVQGTDWEVTLLGIAAVRDPAAALDELLRVGTMLSEEQLRDEERMRVSRALAEWYLEPIRHEGPFDFGNGNYLSRGLALFREAMERGYTRQRPFLTWQTRCFLGVRTLLHRLGARVDMGQLNAEEQAHAGLDS
jgi:aarF domain-containing kinase